MNPVPASLKKLGSWLHHHLLMCLLAMYALALVFPQPGIQVRNLSLGPRFSLPALLLSFLLFNAGLGIQTRDLKDTSKKIKLLASGLLANSLLPMLFLVLASAIGTFWLQDENLQTVLVGLAIIGSMPIAGSSAAWA